MSNMQAMNIAEQIQARCIARGLTVATAESCTGGRIAARLTAVAGSSAYFEGGIVAYQERVKEHLLGVDPETIRKFNVVSEEVARSMVGGACRRLGTRLAVASTGCAGPDGGTTDIPVGTVWLAAGNQSHQFVRCLHTDHGRVANVENAADRALELLLQFIEQETTDSETNENP